MRRSIVEYLAISATAIFIATVSLFAASFHPSCPSDPFEIVGDRWGNGILFVHVKGGTGTLFNEIDFNSRDSPKPWIVVPRNILAPKVTSNHQLTVPGIAFQYCQFAQGPPVWSLGVSLAIPSALWLIAAVLLFRRVRRDRRRAARAPAETA